ncbi:MAG: 50S ribosomal protein L23 [Desulfuromonadaceae bacterium]|nr:50S ribosomal protein L23 [Desulfuromonadaceae bacterium]
MRPLHYIIRRPLLSEKVTSQADRKVVAFEVAKDANKIEVKQALEKAFDIKVQDVKTLVVAGKVKRVGKNFGKRGNWKKAYVTLTPESNMDFFGV